MWFVYILYSSKLDRYYVGRTENVEVRLRFHNNPIERRKYTARGIPWDLRLSIPCTTLAQSIAMEKRIKLKKSREFIELLVSDTLAVEKLIRETST